MSRIVACTFNFEFFQSLISIILFATPQGTHRTTFDEQSIINRLKRIFLNIIWQNTNTIAGCYFKEVGNTDVKTKCIFYQEYMSA